MKQNNILPETSPHSEQSTQPCQKPDLTNCGTGVPVQHFGNEFGVIASLIEWSDGRRSIRIKGAGEMYSQITPPMPADP